MKEVYYYSNTGLEFLHCSFLDADKCSLNDHILKKSVTLVNGDVKVFIGRVKEALINKKYILHIVSSVYISHDN
jgi:hypothetical protein